MRTSTRPICGVFSRSGNLEKKQRTPQEKSRLFVHETCGFGQNSAPTSRVFFVGRPRNVVISLREMRYLHSTAFRLSNRGRPCRAEAKRLCRLTMPAINDSFGSQANCTIAAQTPCRRTEMTAIRGALTPTTRTARRQCHRPARPSVRSRRAGRCGSWRR
jgi:hypothetical protein